MESITQNTLFYGDNLNILREYIPDKSIDLIYLDPPFNSNRNYNVLFKDESGQDSEAQITAFEDTWHWNQAAEDTYSELIHNAPEQVSRMISALREFIGANQMMAYLVMMTARLIELHRVLKDTGSLYLHCDPTASHYLKIVLDAIFGVENFRNEIIWRRTNAHNKLSRQYGPIHDTLLFYVKSEKAKFHPATRPYSKAYIEDRFKYQDEHGRYQTNYLTGPGTRKGESGLAWRGFDPTKVGRHWAIPASLREFLSNAGAEMSTQNQLESLYEQGFILFPKKEGGQPMYKQYIGNGMFYQDIWAYQPNTKGVLFESDECIDEDVKYLENEGEILGYPTQKPVGLLERLIRTSSDEGDWILDPFAGCGTTIAAAQKLNRKWIGIDITHLAIALLKYRLRDMQQDVESVKVGKNYQVIGEPRDLSGANQLAQDNRYQFQWWANGLVEAKPLGGQEGSKSGKKGSDKGIDGIINFIDDDSGKAKRVIVQVKSGKVKSGDIRDLVGTLDREKAAIGVYITLENPTKPMIQEAVSAGHYLSEGWNKQYPKIQILTIEQLLEGAKIDMPPIKATFKQAKKEKKKEHQQSSLEM
jgi:site-specific DNA-methyltransferase (adenine-specific)